MTTPDYAKPQAQRPAFEARAKAKAKAPEPLPNYHGTAHWRRHYMLRALGLAVARVQAEAQAKD